MNTLSKAGARREFLAQSLKGLGGLALGGSLLSDVRLANAALRPPGSDFAPKAKRAIWLFMGGGPSQLDLFDYKPGLRARFNEELPASVRNNQRVTGMTAQSRLSVAPTIFPFARGGQSGAWVSDLLPWTRQIVDELAIVKTVYTESINHDPAMLNSNTGNQNPGKPSLGAWLSYGLGAINENLPAFVVMTSTGTVGAVQPLSSRLWGSGFLPASHAGVTMRGAGEPMLYLPNPAGISGAARRTMLDALHGMNDLAAHANADPNILDRTSQYERAFRLQSAVPTLVDLSSESKASYDLYGPSARTPGSFAANCLLARRMMEQGVRFAQVFHRGWDAHATLPMNHRSQCADIDQAAYGLITDLKQRGLLEDTLVIWSGEFGRTVYSQGELSSENYGRDHHGRCFSVWLAGGGVKPGIVYGETDDFGYNIVSGPVHLRDLHATVLHQFGLDANRLTFSYNGFEQRLVGVDAPAEVVKGILR